MNTKRNTYKNTARGDVLHFVQQLSPTPSEQPFIASIFAKNHVSMRDIKILLEYLARRAMQKPLEAHQIDALGLPTLPVEAHSATNTAPLKVPA